MGGTILAGFPHSLRNDGEFHDTIIGIILPVCSSLAASLSAHISCLGGAFLVDSFRTSQSTWVCDVSCRVYIFC